MLEGKGTLNWQTLGQIISREETEMATKVLSQRQIVSAELNEQAYRLFPIRGQIKERFLFSKNRIVTPEMIEEIVDTKAQSDY